MGTIGLMLFLMLTVLAADPPNLALFKPSSQSSTDTYSGRALVSDFATDGNDNPKPPKAVRYEIAQTEAESKPWWRVDLGKDVPVKTVVIQNRIDAKGDRLKKLTVTVTSSASAQEIFATYAGPGYNGQQLTLVRSEPLVGRWVKIHENHGKSKNHLALVEVKVYSV